MENLSDVEFGSDDSGEEAPILIAQRYLNIFRQVHIFNKAKRDEFDDELLALPVVVSDYFKRMPGGRLLVEHIEKVKTERGIAFIKANKEDFDEGAGKVDTPSAMPAGMGFGGGSVVMDASFAETLAQSMASAFKQIPAPIASGSTTSVDFGNAFDVIAEEIRTSRSSLLDVLKETRSITDTVIASQVSISRILEGILSSRNRDETDVANLNNRIIASQASITKLLEGLYTSQTQKNNDITNYLNVEDKLSGFRKEVRGEIDTALQKMQDMFKEYAETIKEQKVIIEAKDFHPSENNKYSTVERIPEKNVAQNISEIANNQNHEIKQNRPAVQTDFSVSSEPIAKQSQYQTVGENTLSDENRKKKKKKKKIFDGIFVSNKGNSAQGQNEEEIVSKAQFKPNNNVNRNERNIEQNNNAKGVSTKPAVATPNFDGVIRNSEYKHEDDFGHIRLDEPPLDAPFVDDKDDVSFDASNLSENNIKDSENINALGTSFDDAFSALDDFYDSEMDDGLDFALPQNQYKNQNLKSNTNYDEVVVSDGLDFTLPEHSFETADDSFDVSSNEQFSITDSFSDDGLEFTLPQSKDQHIANEPNVETMKKRSFDDADDGLNFVLPQTKNDVAQIDRVESVTSTEIIKEDDEEISLDSFFANDVVNVEEEIRHDTVADVAQQTDVKNENITHAQESRAPSRYSAELEKIRQALTTDNVDISSLNEPIALDDYSDDENVGYDDSQFDSLDSMQNYSATNSVQNTYSEDVQQTSNTQNDEEWEWEYVEDEESDEAQSGEQDDEEWEWEYVEDEETDNNK